MNQKDRDEECRVQHIIGPNAKARGFYSRGEFLELCSWKSRRPERLHAQNDVQSINEVTALSLSTQNERLRIGVLTLLDGVDWPTASALLHFGHKDQYPILDVNALWSLAIAEPPSYKLSFWWDYVQICRGIAAQHGLSMRMLDRALYQYAKENQP